MDIKFVRALWGPLKDFIDEIPKQPLYNEVVVVWGQENCDYLNSLGYDCVLIQDNIDNLHSLDMFRLKLEAIEHTSSLYGKILFLDWDTVQVKPIDSLFYDDFIDKTFCAPLYCYPEKIKTQLNSLGKKSTNEWFEHMYNHLSTNSWKQFKSFVVPMAGFIYISNYKIAKQLLDLHLDNQFRGLIEEVALFNLADCSLDEYLAKYEPSTIWGRLSSQSFTLGKVKGMHYQELNNYIQTKVTKNIYFEHK